MDRFFQQCIWCSLIHPGQVCGDVAHSYFPVSAAAKAIEETRRLVNPIHMSKPEIAATRE